MKFNNCLPSQQYMAAQRETLQYAHMVVKPQAPGRGLLGLSLFLLSSISITGQSRREGGEGGLMLQVEEQKRRAEADKLAAITALEQRSREFMREKEEKRRLETRIANMQSQLLIGGSKLEDTPVFRCAPTIAQLPCYGPLPYPAWLCSPGGLRRHDMLCCAAFVQ